MHKQWTQEEIQWLRQHYASTDSHEGAARFGIDRLQYQLKANQYGLRKHVLRQANMSKFETISDSYVAYFLGFAWADGHLQTHAGRQGLVGSFSMNLQQEDMKAIEWIIDQLGNFGKHYRLAHVSPDGSKHKAQMGIKLCDRRFVRFLYSHDYHLKSSYAPTKILACIPKSLHHYWWRGYFDGDGCISTRDDGGVCRLSIESCYEQDWSHTDTLCKELDIHGSIIKKIRTTGRGSLFFIQRVDSIIKFCTYIYQNRTQDSIGLERKFLKWHKYLSYRVTLGTSAKVIDTILPRREPNSPIVNVGQRGQLAIRNTDNLPPIPVSHLGAYDLEA